MTPDLFQPRDEAAENEWLNPEGIELDGVTGHDFYAIWNKACDWLYAFLQAQAPAFDEKAAAANSSGNNTFTTGARWQHEQLSARIALNIEQKLENARDLENYKTRVKELEAELAYYKNPPVRREDIT